ncbi:hypothetical protein QBC33DRAFT_514231 [Phialemonium atrogriseum]|uniref:Cyclin-dependent kinase n=1 Tax=Phialemonium atrogriseum TaxID=1093897 RepID=A0AAJ0C6N7_9PEZI|nr:uncharacterized protein QBC33DRAFT_514231 [Phialemonium atrogriseum]KAK1768651.1 hypothetical protein QBC33DRAFT_514231 [Phialemonium atrogriseum]
MEASPSKRRVLGSLDPNASSPRPQLGLKQLKSPHHNAPGSPLKRPAEPSPGPQPKKIQLTMEARTELQSGKKAGIEEKAQHLHEMPANAEQPDTDPSQQSPRPSDRHRSASPAASSLFDSSGLDNTQATAMTDPDVDTAIPAITPAVAALAALARPPTRPRLTREEAKEKAEILRLRLGLANYKLRTGQTDVPLEQLQVRPLPGMTPRAVHTTSAASAAADRPARRPLPGAPVRRRSEEGLGAGSSQSSQSSSQGSSKGEEDEEVEGPGGSRRRVPSPEERPSLPRLPAQSAVKTPRGRRHLELDEGADAERLTSSALRGGAANGLLSLARG